MLSKYFIEEIHKAIARTAAPPPARRGNKKDRILVDSQSDRCVRTRIAPVRGQLLINLFQRLYPEDLLKS